MGTFVVDLDVSFAKGLEKKAPTVNIMQKWIYAVLAKAGYKNSTQMCIRIVEEQEMTDLNSKFRKVNKVTNVLSFPYEALPGVKIPFLGDLVICANVVDKEAKQQSKTSEQHWAHLIVHGVLHLLGYDHINEADAVKMEKLEIEILSELGFPNPYGEIYTS